MWGWMGTRLSDNSFQTPWAVQFFWDKKGKGVVLWGKRKHFVETCGVWYLKEAYLVRSFLWSGSHTVVWGSEFRARQWVRVFAVDVSRS